LSEVRQNLEEMKKFLEDNQEDFVELLEGKYKELVLSGTSYFY
jgi:PHD/YefM family antitoxin component YafN of YafNO toxin-antitoxin module